MKKAAHLRAAQVWQREDLSLRIQLRRAFIRDSKGKGGSDET